VFFTEEGNDRRARRGACDDSIMVTRTRRVSTRRRLLLAGAIAALVYAWIVAGLRPFTDPENILVALPMIPVFVLAARRRPSSPIERMRPLDGAPVARGAVVWVALFVAFAAWEVIALFSSPRDDHPTLSSIADRIMSTHPGRTVVVFTWLVVGAALAFRRSPVVGR
jgi:hypothetical protein